MAEIEPSTGTIEVSPPPPGHVASNGSSIGQETNAQDEPATLSTLNERELRDLLDEAITYKNPKDREGKSSLFKELLEEAEADETEDRRNWGLTNSRGLPGSNRRRNKRDTVSERLTHGGSLQNLAQSINSEFDSTSANNPLSYGGTGKKKGSKRHNASAPTNVSARQREGGSLPSNVNAGNFDLVLDKRTAFLEEKSIRSVWDKRSKKGEEKFFQNGSNSSSNCDAGDAINGGTNEMLDSDNPPPDYDKQDCMVIDLEDIESSSINDRNASVALGSVQRPSLDADNEEEGTEMKTIENRRPLHYVTRATFDIPQIPVDSPLDLPTFRDHHHSGGGGAGGKLDSKSKISVNGTEGTTVGGGGGASLPFPPYSNVKCVMSSSPPSLYSVVPWPPNLSMVSRITAQHIAGGKEALAASDACGNANANKDGSGANINGTGGGANSASGGGGDKGAKKTLDENGNAVQGGHSGDRKKSRRKNEQKEIVYQAKDVKGHRYEADIELLVNFIENKDNKGGKKGSSGGNKTTGGGSSGVAGGGGASVVVGGVSSSAVSKVNKTSANSKSRSRDNKDVKRKEISAKLQKSNSLEEISKISKLEDLTTEKETLSSNSSTASSQNGPVNVALRRVKQRSIGDTQAVDSRGDRRSWGTEEGQSIYCNDTGDDYNAEMANGAAGARQRNVAKKNILENEAETEFHVVMNKKKKTKKQRRRSSSGGRVQNSSANQGYLQRGRGFSSEYRATLSPELRRKSASSMPPSDKSDSSDLDSVHSLPVTCNSKNANSNSAPQASYAEIARMASMQTTPNAAPASNPTPTHNPVANVNASNNPSNIIPNINTSTWPSVSSSKTEQPAEQQKWQSPDYYPSLDELQQGPSSDHRKTRANNPQQQATSPTPVNSAKPKPNSGIDPSSKKPLPPAEVEDQISQISTKQLVQDVDKVRQGGDHWHRQRDVASSKNSSNTSSPNANEVSGGAKVPGVESGAGISLPPKSSDSSINVSSSHESGNNSDDSSSKHSSANSKSSGSLASGSYAKKATLMTSTVYQQQQQPQQPQNLNVQDKNPKPKRGNTTAAAGPQLAESSDECGRFSSPAAEVSEYSARYNKAERYVKASRGQSARTMGYQPAPTYRSNKKYYTPPRGSEKDTKAPEMPQHPQPPQQQQQQSHDSPSSNSISRPAVILLDEKTDQFNSMDSSSEFTFGFDINEQLLQSEELTSVPCEEYEENPVTSPEQSRSSTSTPNFGKPPTNIQVHPPFAGTGQVVVSSTNQTSFVGFTGSYPLPQAEKRRSSSAGSSSAASAGGQQKEELSAIPRFLAPEDLDVQHYNHDKIVSFVGSAWDDVMQEMPPTASGNGKVRYYSEQ